MVVAPLLLLSGMTLTTERTARLSLMPTKLLAITELARFISPAKPVSRSPVPTIVASSLVFANFEVKILPSVVMLSRVWAMFSSCF